MLMKNINKSNIMKDSKEKATFVNMERKKKKRNFRRNQELYQFESMKNTKSMEK
jgi:hypothetical protein